MPATPWAKVTLCTAGGLTMVVKFVVTGVGGRTRRCGAPTCPVTVVPVGVLGAAGRSCSNWSGGMAIRRARRAWMRWGSLIVVFGPLVSATTKLITNFESMSTTNPEFPGTVTVGRQIRESLMGHYLTTSIHHVAGIFRCKILQFRSSVAVHTVFGCVKPTCGCVKPTVMTVLCTRWKMKIGSSTLAVD